MAPATRSYFLDLAQAVRQVLDEVTFERLDLDEQRAVWELHGTYGGAAIHLKEVFNQSGRMYAYYVVRKGQMVAGFDNYPDRRALQLNYGPDFRKYVGTLLPHRHGADKNELDLTVEMDVRAFLLALAGIVGDS